MKYQNNQSNSRIILLFIDDDDRATDLVCFWLKKLGKCFWIVRKSDEIFLTEENGNLFLCKDSNISNCVRLDQITSVYNFIGQIAAPFLLSISSSIETQINQNILNESIKVLKYILNSTHVERSIGDINFEDSSFNKLTQLRLAKEVGIKVPEYRLVSTLASINSCFKEWERLIVKNVDVGISIRTTTLESLSQRTIELSKEDRYRIPTSFGLTFVQRFIKSSYEIRVIYLLGTTYSVARINNFKKEKTVDIRESDEFVRIVPTNLPTDLEIKITKLMSLLKLNYGALDILLGDDNEYYFLEVNPYGQYGFVSYFGNYGLEKIIAEAL